MLRGKTTNPGRENLGEDKLKDRAVPKPYINEGAGQMSGALATKACTLRAVPETGDLQGSTLEGVRMPS